MSTAIQKRETTDLVETLTSPEWPRPVIEVLRQQCCPKGIPEQEFYVFVKKCVQTGLNPLVGEAFCIPRNSKGPDGKPVTIFTFQPSAEGMRARAGRFPDFVKVDGAAVYELDPVALIDEGTGEVQHKFNAAKPRGRLMGAWGRVEKKGTTPIVVWLPAGARRADGPVWSSDPGGHLAKCSMVQALRQAYPVAFAGVYAREEMPDEAPAPSMAETVLSRASGDAPVAAPKVEVLPPAGPTVAFGEWKGRPVSCLSLEECDAAQSFALAEMGKAPNAKWVDKMRANLELLQAHRETLVAPKVPEPEDAQTEPSEPREPGQEG